MSTPITGSSAAGFGAIRGVDEHSKGDDKNPTVKEFEVTYEGYVEKLRNKFNTGVTKDVEWRLKQLRKLKKAWIDNKEAVFECLAKDHGRPKVMSNVFEYATVLAEINLMIKKTKKWASPKSVHTGLGLQPATSHVYYEPKGIILCIGPWNFPFFLTLVPIANMIASGNCVLLKPSELSVHSSALVTKIIEETLDPEAFVVVNGAVPETTALLSRNWDHIMYTGNGMVGRIVMRAAAEHLTPVTLELGGKSPVYIDEHVDLEMAATRLVNAKISCTGQVCIAPDYVLVHQERKEKFLEVLKKKLVERLGEKPVGLAECGKIINERHWDRVASLLKDHEGEVIYGGLDFSSREDRYIPTTIVVDPKVDSRLMLEEIFGPVLPIVTVLNTSEAIEFINARDHPLALYVFTSSKKTQKRFTVETSSGALTINDCIYHAASSSIPFGGVGAAGMGAYRGFDGFSEFSHKKGIVKRGTIEISKLHVRTENEGFIDFATTLLNKFGLF